jgi:hypothetical protein
MNISKIIVVICLFSFLTSCSISGHKNQNWHPRTSKKMQKGHNNK